MLISPTPLASGGVTFPLVNAAGQLSMEVWVNPASTETLSGQYPFSVLSLSAATGTCASGVRGGATPARPACALWLLPCGRMTRFGAPLVAEPGVWPLSPSSFVEAAVDLSASSVGSRTNESGGSAVSAGASSEL